MLGNAVPEIASRFALTGGLVGAPNYTNSVPARQGRARPESFGKFGHPTTGCGWSELVAKNMPPSCFKRGSLPLAYAVVAGPIGLDSGDPVRARPVLARGAAGDVEQAARRLGDHGGRGVGGLTYRFLEWIMIVVLARLSRIGSVSVRLPGFPAPTT